MNSNTIMRNRALEKQKKEQGRKEGEEFKKIIQRVKDPFVDIALKHLNNLIKNDLENPLDQRIFSGPGKNPESVITEVEALAKDEKIQEEIVSAAVAKTFGVAIFIRSDIEQMIQDAVHHADFYDIIENIVDGFLKNTRLEKILVNPNKTNEDKLVEIQPILKSELNTFIHFLGNGCYFKPRDPYMFPDDYDSVCLRRENLQKKRQADKSAQSLLDTGLGKLGSKFGKTFGFNEGKSTNVLKGFLKEYTKQPEYEPSSGYSYKRYFGGKTRRSKRSRARKHKTRYHK